MLEELRKEDFDPHRQEIFRLAVGEPAAALELRLIEVTSLAADRAAPTARRKPFSLLFRGPLTPWMRQHTYALEHPALGRLEIFLVPVGPDGEGMRYEAIFT